MGESLPLLPETLPDDHEDVVWGLQTATALWARGEHREALVWVRRAAEAAGAAGADMRAVGLAKHAVAIEEYIGALDAAPPEPTSPPESTGPRPGAALVSFPSVVPHGSETTPAPVPVIPPDAPTLKGASYGTHTDFEDNVGDRMSAPLLTDEDEIRDDATIPRMDLSGMRDLLVPGLAPKSTRTPPVEARPAPPPPPPVEARPAPPPPVEARPAPPPAPPVEARPASPPVEARPASPPAEARPAPSSTAAPASTAQPVAVASSSAPTSTTEISPPPFRAAPEPTIAVGGTPAATEKESARPLTKPPPPPRTRSATLQPGVYLNLQAAAPSVGGPPPSSPLPNLAPPAEAKPASASASASADAVAAERAAAERDADKAKTRKKQRAPILDPWADDLPDEPARFRVQYQVTDTGPGSEDDVITSAALIDVTLRRKPPPPPRLKTPTEASEPDVASDAKSARANGDGAASSGERARPPAPPPPRRTPTLTGQPIASVTGAAPTTPPASGTVPRPPTIAPAASKAAHPSAAPPAASTTVTPTTEPAASDAAERTPPPVPKRREAPTTDASPRSARAVDPPKSVRPPPAPARREPSIVPGAMPAPVATAPTPAPPPVAPKPASTERPAATERSAAMERSAPTDAGPASTAQPAARAPTAAASSATSAPATTSSAAAPAGAAASATASSSTTATTSAPAVATTPAPPSVAAAPAVSPPAVSPPAVASPAPVVASPPAASPAAASASHAGAPAAPALSTSRATPAGAGSTPAPPSVAPPQRVASSAPPSSIPREVRMVAGLPLERIDAFADLPPELQKELADTAVVHELGPNDEQQGFGVLVVISGVVDVCATIADIPAVMVAEGGVVPATTSISDVVAVRAVATSNAKVATWTKPQIESAMKACPWVLEELVRIGDRFAALAGATMGPLGDLDDESRRRTLDMFRVRALRENEVFQKQGDDNPGLTLVGGGELVVGHGEERPQQLGSGEIVFPATVLDGGPAPREVRAGEGGALLLTAPRSTTVELFSTMPMLLELLR